MKRRAYQRENSFHISKNISFMCPSTIISNLSFACLTSSVTNHDETSDLGVLKDCSMKSIIIFRVCYNKFNNTTHQVSTIPMCLLACFDLILLGFERL